MFIEDLIRKTSNYNFFSTTVYNQNLDAKESQMLDSFCEQLDRGNNLTEKQAIVVLRILKKCKDQLRPEIPKIDDILDNPTWKNPFRVLSTAKRFGIDRRESSPNVYENYIYVEFPYDNAIVESFKKRNTSVNELHRGVWNIQSRKWEFALTESNVLWLGDYLRDAGFSVDKKFMEYYGDANSIRSDIEEHLPMLVYKNDQYSIVNLPFDIEPFTTDNLTEALFLARNYGVTCWDDNIDARINNHEISYYTKLILGSNIRNRPWINSDEVSIGEFATDLLKFNDKILIVIPGGSELNLTSKWVKFAKTLGIDNSQMSVMFRLPNEQAAFNEFVRDEKLNNPVSDSTRIVFVNTKITKPVIKSNIKFDLVINLGYYNYMHYTMETMVENAPLLVYYNIKEPAKTRKWLPQEL